MHICRFLAIFSFLVVFILSIHAEQDGDYTYSVANDTATITAFTTTGTTANIPDTLGGYPVTTIGSGAFQNRLSLETVVIGNGVTEIGPNAFSGCTNLLNLTFGVGLKTIRYGAFVDCKRLVSVTLPDSLEVLENSNLASYGVFSHCFALESVTFGTGLRTLGANAFYNCQQLAEVVLPGTVTTLGNSAFEGCTALKSARLNEGLLSLGDGVFSGCYSMTNIAMPGTLGSIGGGAFANCAALQSLDIPDNVTNLNWSAVSDCTGLKSVVIGDGVTSIGDNAFQNRLSLETVTFGNSVMEIGCFAFDGCTNLQSATFGSGLIKINKAAFRNCTRLASLTFPDSLQELEDAYYTEGVFYNCTSLASVDFGSGLRKVGNAAFYGCSKLSEVILPDTLTTIGDDAFSGCSSLQVADLGGGLQTLGGGAFSGCTSVTNIAMPSTLGTVHGYAFYNCAALTSLNIPDSVTNLNWSAMNGCTSFKSVVIGDGVTTIGDSAFQNRMSLETVVIGDGVTNIEQWAFQNCTNLLSVSFGNSLLAMQQGAFKNCSRLESVTFPDSLEELGDAGYWSNGVFYNCTSLASVTFGTGLIKIGQYTFNACTNLTELALPDSVVTISAHAFESCTALRSIHLGANTQTLGDYTFWHCFALTNVVMPETLLSIGAYTFQQCTSLQQIVIPASVTQIGDNAFIDCTALTGVYFKGNAPTVSLSAFSGASNVTAYYLLGTVGWEPTLANRPTAVWEVSAPMFAPQDGTLITNSLQVVIACATEGASIHYTLDDSEPTTNSLLYSVPLLLTNTTTIKAKAFRANMADSAMATAQYYLWDATPAFAPPNGRVFTNALDVMLSCPSENITIRYTTDGGDVTTGSTAYTAPIHLTASAVVKARSYVGETAVSEQVQASYMLQSTATPVFLPADGTVFTNRLTVGIVCANAGASIRYTLDGTTPDDSSILYTGAFEVVCTKRVTAKAFAPGFAPSTTASATYTQALEGSLDNTNLTFVTGDAAWVSQDAETYDGVDATRSGAIGNGQDSWVSTEVIGPGEIAFKWKVESELMQDFLKFYTNQNVVAQISGWTSWQSHTIEIGSGPQTIKWAYQKDISASSGRDCGWLDEVRWYPYSLALPTFDPIDGTTFDKTLSVTIACTDESAVIRYTTDGSEPVESSPVYAQPIEINATTTIRAKAFSENARSLTVCATYTKLEPVATPTFTPAEGTTFETDLSVMLSCASEGAEIRYTLDGSEPTTNSALYATAIELSETTTVKARAYKRGMIESAVSSATYTRLEPAAVPTFNPSSGTIFEGMVLVELFCATEGAEIRYTLNNMEPTAESALYTAAIELSATTTVKARAYKSGMAASVIASATYTRQAPSGSWSDQGAYNTDWYAPACSVFSISNAQQLAGLAVLVNAGNSFMGKEVMLTADVSLTGRTWIAIGTAAVPFYGQFHGCGKTIDGMTVSQPTSDNQGLFGYLSTGGIIQNVTLKRASVVGRTCVGGVVGCIYHGTVKNCMYSGNVSAHSQYAGGIVGRNRDGMVMNCMSAGAVTGTEYIGGIGGGCTTDANILNCLSTSATFIAFLGDYGPGGIIGNFFGTVAYCYWKNDGTTGYNWYAGPSALGYSGTYSFTTPPGTLSDFHDAYQTDSLLEVLNAWVQSNQSVNNTLLMWTTEESESGYPILAINDSQMTATPTFDPADGTAFETTLAAMLSCATSGAEIRYTLDGSDPTTNSTLYASELTLEQTTTVKARAFKSGMAGSMIASATYIRLDPAATPTFDPANGTTFETSLPVTLSCTTTGAEIRYTLDGSTPTTNSALYATALTLTQTTTIKARAFKSSMAGSAVATATYTKLVPAATPTFAPADGTAFETILSVSLACATSGAEIRYTLDGSTPTTNSALYATALALTQTTTIKVRAFKAGMAGSAIASATYTKQASAGIIRITPTTLAFGSVAIGRSATNVFNVFNDGETTLTISSISCPTGFAVSTTSFTVGVGKTTTVAVAFAPGTQSSFSGMLSIASDALSGSSSIVVTGTGLIASPVVSQIVLSASSVIGGSGSWPLAAYNATAYGAQHVIDNQSGPISEAAPGNFWLGREDYTISKGAYSNEYFLIDLGAQYNLSRVDLFNTHNQTADDRATKNFILFGSNTTTYQNANTGQTMLSPITLLTGQLTFQNYANDPIEAQTYTAENGLVAHTPYRYLMFKAVDFYTPKGVYANQGSGLNEIRVYGSLPIATVAAPSFSPGNGAIFDTPLSVTLSCTTAGATIRYTLDGREPSAVSPVYTTGIVLSGSTIVKARAFKSDCYDSQTSVAVYSRSGQTTQLSPVPVPHTWLANYQLIADGNYEAAALADRDGDGYKAWEEYVAGTCPTNCTSVFLSNITLSNGALHVTWRPDLGTQRKYTIEGKPSLNNQTWISPTNADSRFFRIKVDLP